MNEQHEHRRRNNDNGQVAYWLKAAAGVVTSVTILGIALAWAADTRYAQKADVLIAVHNAIDGLRKASVEDKIFEINLVSPDNRTDVQRALLDRYLREAETLKSKIQ